MRHEKIFLTEEKYNLQFSWWGSVYLVSRLPDQCRVTVRGVAGAKWPLVSVSPTCTGVVTLLYSTVQYTVQDLHGRGHVAVAQQHRPLRALHAHVLAQTAPTTTRLWAVHILSGSN